MSYPTGWRPAWRPPGSANGSHGHLTGVTGGRFGRAGWLVAGRVLRPLRQKLAATRAVSEDNQHQRLNLAGPGDELKDLGDTIDSLLERLHTPQVRNMGFNWGNPPRARL